MMIDELASKLSIDDCIKTNFIFGQYYSKLFNIDDFVLVNRSKESVEKELQDYRLLG